MREVRKVLVIALRLSVLALPGIAGADSLGSSGGLTLISPYSARSAALAESVGAAPDDISVLSINPSVLPTMRSGQASLQYRSGALDDRFGHFAIGLPAGTVGGLGLAVGFYDGGAVELLDAGGQKRAVSAQKDLTVAISGGRSYGRLTTGLTGKYLRSELAEQYHATAWALDAGLGLSVSDHVRVGASVQNIGTDLTYISDGDPLPRMASAHLAVSGPTGRSVTSVFLDGRYGLNESEFSPAVGVETRFGVLALRGGYRADPAGPQFSIGTGVLAGSLSFDYAFGLMSGVDADHRVSLAMRFGEAHRPSLARSPSGAPARAVRQLSRPTLESARPKSRTVYLVKPGDSLASIAKREYGDANRWRSIFMANRHLISAPTEIKEGMRIVLP